MHEDLTGREYGKWKVAEYAGSDRNGAKWLCLCSCKEGTQRILYGYKLRTGRTLSCGCSRKNDLTEMKFGKLKVLSPCGKDKNGCILWECECECGRRVNVSSTTLRRHMKQSCGCMASENGKEKIKDAEKRLTRIQGTCVESFNAKLSKANTSGYKGVSYDRRRKKWVAQIQYAGKGYHLGRYEKIEEAIKARKEAEEKIKNHLKEKSKQQ